MPMRRMGKYKQQHWDCYLQPVSSAWVSFPVTFAGLCCRLSEAKVHQAA